MFVVVVVTEAVAAVDFVAAALHIVTRRYEMAKYNFILFGPMVGRQWYLSVFLHIVVKCSI